MDGLFVCSTCHDQHNNTYSPFLRVPKEQGALCQACHADRFKGRYLDDTAANIGHHPIHVTLPRDDRYSTTVATLVLEDPGTPADSTDDTVECLTCHTLHRAPAGVQGAVQTGSGDGRLLRTEASASLCTACHLYQNHQGRDCLDCHTVHQTSNILLVRETIDNKPVDHTAQTYDEFIHGSPNFDGLCEMCHTATQYHRNNASGDHTHYVGQRCSQCHVHRNNFAFTANDCLSCHHSSLNVTPDGRPVRAVSDDFFTGNYHHPLAYNINGDLNDPQDNNCLICHLERSYNDPLHADEKVDLDPDPDGSGQQEWQTYTYGVWCLDCHDGDNPNPARRLNGQIAPDKSFFGDQSTHKGGFFGGLCDSCHVGGHTVESKFFSIFWSDGREENNCYGCHGGSANVSTVEGNRYQENIKVAYVGLGSVSPRSRHNEGPTNDGHTFCRDCHDPHRLDHYNNILCDPDDPTQSWNGDVNDAFCLRCHDGTQADPPSHPDFDVAGRECTQCHLPHASTNLNLLLIQDMATTTMLVQVQPDPATVPVGQTEYFDPILTPALDYMPLTVRRHQAEWSMENLTGGSAGDEYTVDANIPLDETVGTIVIDPMWGGHTLTVSDSTLLTTAPAYIQDVNLRVDVKHHYRGDLEFTLRNLSNGLSATVLQADWGDWATDLNVILNSESPNSPHTNNLEWDTAPDSLTVFNERNANGQWELELRDTWSGDNTAAACFWNSWSLIFNSGVLGTMTDGTFQALYEGTGRVHAKFHHGKIWPVQSGLSGQVFENPLPISSAVDLTVTTAAAAGTTPAAPTISPSGKLNPPAPLKPKLPKENLREGVRQLIADEQQEPHSDTMLQRLQCADCHQKRHP